MNNTQRLKAIAALRSALKYLKVSGEPEYQTAEFVTPAQAMRRAADEIERKDDAVRYAREVLRELEAVGGEA